MYEIIGTTPPAIFFSLHVLRLSYTLWAMTDRKVLKLIYLYKPESPYLLLCCVAIFGHMPKIAKRISTNQPIEQKI